MMPFALPLLLPLLVYAAADYYCLCLMMLPHTLRHAAVCFYAAVIFMPPAHYMPHYF